MNHYILAGIIVASSYTTWYVTSDHYQKELSQQENKWQAAYIASANSAIDQAAAVTQTRHDSEVQHGKDQGTINNLAGELNRRMQSHIPTRSCESSSPGTASPGTDGGAGLFSAGVDAEFGKFSRRTEELINRCAQLNIDTIRLNSEIVNCGR